jgi:arylsulfatase A-like enzyme
MKSIAILLLTCALSQALEKPARPNVIVIFTDDHGYTDLSCVGTEPDVKTPNLDRMAAEGVRFTDGYVTAPQCCPSRAGLLTGRDQNRFGLGANGDGPLPLAETTIADRLGKAGYVTGMVGKWHLDLLRKDQDPGDPQDYHPIARGFQETFNGQINNYSATYDLAGKRFDKPRMIRTKGDRLDRQSDAAVGFIDLHHAGPFFLYLAYFAPHVPLASPRKYLDRFPGEMPERRRYALAMISAVDDGVGRIMERLEHHGIDRNTMIFFIGDNGAPLKLTMPDDPVQLSGAYWNGSKNTPLNGEKGMLAEGGIRVPFLARWKGTIPGGQVCKTPVSSLDVAATACAVAGLERPATFDGLNILPMIKEGKPAAVRTLCWRFWNQAAVRVGDWKLLKLSDQQSFLFDLSKDKEEKINLAAQHPDIVQRLESSLNTWATQLTPAGLPAGKIVPQEKAWYQRYFQHP